MNNTNKAVSKGIAEESTQVKAAARILKLGLDLHYRQVTAGMQEDGGRIKPTGKMCYQRFVNWVQKKLAEDWEIHSCYEAGASGYWLHRDLVTKGVKNLVVAPKPMDQGGKKQKRIESGVRREQRAAVRPRDRNSRSVVAGSRLGPSAESSSAWSLDERTTRWLACPGFKPSLWRGMFWQQRRVPEPTLGSTRPEKVD